MKAFYEKANTDLNDLQEYYRKTVDCYNMTCSAFGENAKTLKSTEFFSYIVSFISSLKTSHKHLLDVQAEEKVKKVTQDWQNIVISNSQHRHQQPSTENKQPPSPPQFRLPDPTMREKQSPIPIVEQKTQGQEQNGKNAKKRSLWARLLKWGS